MSTSTGISSLHDEEIEFEIREALREPPPADFKPSLRLYLAFLTLAVITMAVALDGTSLSVALPIISEKLKGTAIEAFWSGTSFLLCSTIFQPSFASFSHIFGRKPVIMVALLLFLVGAIIAAVANGFAVLLVGRSLQGVGGGGLIALTEIVVTDLVPLRVRGKWFGIISGMWSLGSVTGPVIGGAFAQNVSWRWIFYINLPIIGVAFVFVPLFLKLNFKPSNLTSQLRRVDWLGSILFIGSTTSFLIPITWGGVTYAWSSWRTLVPLLIGLTGLTSFIIYEEFLTTEPLIPLTVFKNRTAAVSYLGTTIHGMILWCLLYYLPLYYEAVKGETPILSGVSLFPQTFTVAPAAVIVGILVSKTGRYRWAVWTGWLLTTLGTALLYLLDVPTPTPSRILLNLVSGLGTGMLFAGMAFAIQASASNKDLAFAVAMFSFFRAFGQALGVALGGTVFQNQIKARLRTYPALASNAEQYSRDAAALVQIIKDFPREGADAKGLLVKSYADALKVVWLTMCGLSAVAMVASAWTVGLDMDRPLETEQGFWVERERRRRESEALGERKVSAV
ncbi:MAG: hypothetical protein HETSPECPRED_007822 [Heterodermia speciosa]|uniref:Major facilitator superfamily (MFS) profile domain-containing protein n=1 Tax=Heterodermia speciosa TaxID=116794 RepID=A0A8H3FUX7_9LECA|nr:MAG: hypothetical protein HETSPECPRED_007822 [Heterodermia speciosa]